MWSRHNRNQILNPKISSLSVFTITRFNTSLLQSALFFPPIHPSGCLGMLFGSFAEAMIFFYSAYNDLD